MMIGRSQPKTKSSRTLLRVVVSEIDLKSESTDIGLDTNRNNVRTLPQS